MKRREALFRLSHCREIGITRKLKLLSSLQHPSPALPSIAQLQHLLSIPFDKATKLHKEFHSIPYARLKLLYADKGIEWLTIHDEEYPDLLKEVYDPPLLLFCKGRTELLHTLMKLAIIGARKCTPYTGKVLTRLIPSLSQHCVTVISGLARGADTIAHETTIRSGGKTIGVIAGGFDHIYPKENAALASHMMDHHLMISEYPPDTRPEKWQFPLRNRIISGLSHAVLVTEAQRKSGTYSTADYALNEGRDVFCIPGPLFAPMSEGTNSLIQEGARMVISAEDILQELSQS
ncbi:DNA-processing protein DprA [Rossellomorea marisflavi]|uniref:DNA-processing protein DprA n=1 Tax=Rossellomorea marisflavi TaxID=189381 RepID=UPI0028899252|nr:DNA-processing protein DprA [Rossellomorea marisflavi]